jgi:TolA-binding protein
MTLVGAALGLGALGVGLSRLQHVPDSVALAPAGGSVVVLADGSRVTLDGDARLEVPINEPAHVATSLERGSALFDVVPDHDRSFTVIVGEVEVRVVGTQFRVDRDPTSRTVTVAVIRGVVEVRNTAEPGEVHRLGAGESWSTPRAEVAPSLPLSPSAGALAAPSADPIVPGPGPSTARSAAAPIEDARSLFEAANQARRSGDLARASAHYRELMRRYPSDPRARIAALELGRLEMDRGSDPLVAEQALRTASSAEAGSSVHEDALARLVQLYAAKGDTNACQVARGRYLAAYPNGVHSAQVRAACASR